MKGFIRHGLAVAMVLVTAMPAMARSWVVCVDTTKDARFSTTNTFFVGAAPIYPGSTDVSAASDCSTATIGKATVGTFFTLGGAVAGLPVSTPSNPADGFYVVWHFRIDGRGAFDTTGPTQTATTYPQTITGSTNPGLVPTHGKASVTNLSNATTGTTNAVLTFKITTPEGH